MARRLIGCLLGLGLALVPVVSVGQSGVDLGSPEMTEATMTRADVEAALAAATPQAPPNFERARLNGLDLGFLDFSGANLRAARMNGTRLAGVRLDGADLSQAWMLGANLEAASLKGATLFQTQLGRANLRSANLSGARAAADFTGADLSAASLRGADLSADMRNQSMGLMRGVLRNATADGADFTDAKLMRADLEFGSFRDARFAGADLSMATLGGADLTGAGVAGARFDGADLASAKLRELKGLEQGQLEAARNLARAIRQ
jgi:uncharacterized protein YjbI with pentapeptide repeats